MTAYIGVPPNFTYIYALTCPFTGEVRYVGKADKPIKRLAEHRGRSGRSPVARWVQALRELGKKPNMIILDCVPNSAWPFYEKWWVQKVKREATDLLNVGPGGGGTSGVHHWRPINKDG